MPLPAGRRDRALGSGKDIIREVVAEKVLHGWLQNRHQTLYPLTVNLRTLDDAKRGTLARMMAVALLAGTEDGVQERARKWLAAAGADPTTLAALDAAIAHPPAIDRLMAAVSAQDLAAYAYVVTLISLDLRDPASVHFLDYVAARLAVPTTVVRSANRRYRR